MPPPRTASTFQASRSPAGGRPGPAASRRLLSVRDSDIIAIAMAEKLKDMFFTRRSLTQVADAIGEHYPRFKARQFVKMIVTPAFDDMELKQKMRHVTVCLHETLPRSYAKALDILIKAAPQVTGFEGMCLPDYVELYGLEDWDLSLPALAHFTRFSSSEFAIRPFIAQDPHRAMAFLSDLAENEDPNVRRFASEGCRPRLPWAMALPAFKQDPTPILPILEKLKDDDSEFVRKSVANNLNDISKDHRELVLETCTRWQGRSRNADWIIKRACRSLLKAGDRQAMLLFGFGDPQNIDVDKLAVSPKKIHIGDDVRVSFRLRVGTREACKVRIEYAVYFVKANGKTSMKVFQITESELAPGEHAVSKKHSFANMSTRKHYPGRHDIAIIVNGVEKTRTAVSLSE